METPEPPFTQDQQQEILVCLVSNAWVAHCLIEAAIEGRPLVANRLENYYSNWQKILETMDADGCLISEELTVQILYRWLNSANASPKAH